MSILSVANIWFDQTATNRFDRIPSNNLIRIVSDGGVIIPSGNTVQRPTANLNATLRYNTDYNSLEVYDSVSSIWRTASGASGTGGNRAFFENTSNITSDYTITTGYNAGTFGPVTLNTGVTVTLPANSVWTVV